MFKAFDIVLVDCENVGYDHSFNSDTRVIYFVGKHDIPLNNLKETERIINFKDYETGTKNAQDFIIISELGFLIRHFGREHTYIILSGDKGFDVTCKFWKSKGYSVLRCSPKLSPKENININKHDYKTFGLSRLACYRKLDIEDKIKISNWYWNARKIKRGRTLKHLKMNFHKKLSNYEIELMTNQLVNYINGGGNING